MSFLMPFYISFSLSREYTNIAFEFTFTMSVFMNYQKSMYSSFEITKSTQVNFTPFMFKFDMLFKLVWPWCRVWAYCAR